jgi:hypothetical protein
MTRMQKAIWLFVVIGCSHSPRGNVGTGTWTVVSAVTTDDLQSISGTSSGDLWISGATTLWHGDGTIWNAVASPTGAPVGGPYQYTAVFAAGFEDEWYSTGVTHEPVWHRTGTKWTSYDLHDNRNVGTLWGTSTGDVWGVAPASDGNPGYTGHWDGTAWTHIDSLSTGAIWGSSPLTVWVVGVQGSLDTACTETLSGQGSCSMLSSPMVGLWGTASNDLWAVGTGRAAHSNGSTWSEQALPSAAALHGVWASAADDYWTIGDRGTILHFDGSAWTQVPSPTTANLRAVWGTDANDVWAVGDKGTVLHFQ